ncbi:unnamed protein product [Boreogadus saida]
MEEKLIISVSAFPEIFNTNLAGYKDWTVKTKAWLKVSEEVGLTDLSCEEREAAAASTHSTTTTNCCCAVTTPPIAPVRTQNRRRERERETEIEIERLLLEVLRRQTAPVPPPVPLILSEDEHFFKGILPSLQRLPPHAKEQVKFQIYKLLYDANCCHNPVQFNLINQFGPVDE